MKLIDPSILMNAVVAGEGPDVVYLLHNKNQ